MAAEASYADRLKAAIERSGISVREVARRLAEETGNPIDDERSAIYRYLKKTEPLPERAELLAEILSARELATVTPMAKKRRDRLAAVEEEVAQLRSDLDRFVRAASERRAEIEEDQEIPTRLEDRPSTRDSES